MVAVACLFMPEPVLWTHGSCLRQTQENAGTAQVVLKTLHIDSAQVLIFNVKRGIKK